MKTIKFLRAVIVLFGLLLSACAPSAAPAEAPANVGGGKAISEVIFSGVIESMNGDEWVINGATVQVDPSVIRDGSFNVGDTVKVEASVSADGSVIAQRVETPTAADLADNSNSSPEAEPTSAPADGSVQSLVFDDGGTEAFGTLETLTDTSITVGGETFPLAQGAEVKGEVLPGALVKIHFTVNADGTLSVTEVESADLSQIGGDNGNDDNSNDNSNDDNGNDDNSNGDDSDDDNSNDDNGNDNSDDDTGNDDNSGSDDDDSDDSNDNS
jgi:Domain of unknown function (DUF5666)